MGRITSPRFIQVPFEPREDEENLHSRKSTSASWTSLFDSASPSVDVSVLLQTMQVAPEFGVLSRDFDQCGSAIRRYFNQLWISTTVTLYNDCSRELVEAIVVRDHECRWWTTKLWGVKTPHLSLATGYSNGQWRCTSIFSLKRFLLNFVSKYWLCQDPTLATNKQWYFLHTTVLLGIVYFKKILIRSINTTRKHVFCLELPGALVLAMFESGTNVSISPDSNG
jgi:hypothetical protein